MNLKRGSSSNAEPRNSSDRNKRSTPGKTALAKSLGSVAITRGRIVIDGEAESLTARNAARQHWNEA